MCLRTTAVLLQLLLLRTAVGSCQCGLLLLLETGPHRPWTLAEPVLKGAPRPSGCGALQDEVECLNICANTTTVLTGEMDFHMLPVQLSVRTQRHICRTLKPRQRKVSTPPPPATPGRRAPPPDGDSDLGEAVARTAPLGGFYRHCGGRWQHTGVVFPDRLCCLRYKTVDCNDVRPRQRLPFLTQYRRRR